MDSTHEGTQIIIISVTITYGIGRKWVRVLGSSSDEEEVVLGLKLTLYCFSFIFVKGRKEGKKTHFQTGLLSSSSPRGNLRLQTAASLMGPVRHRYQTL